MLHLQHKIVHIYRIPLTSNTVIYTQQEHMVNLYHLLSSGRPARYRHGASGMVWAHILGNVIYLSYVSLPVLRKVETMIMEAALREP